MPVDGAAIGVFKVAAKDDEVAFKRGNPAFTEARTDGAFQGKFEIRNSRKRFPQKSAFLTARGREVSGREKKFFRMERSPEIGHDGKIAQTNAAESAKECCPNYVSALMPDKANKPFSRYSATLRQ